MFHTRATMLLNSTRYWRGTTAKLRALAAGQIFQLASIVGHKSALTLNAQRERVYELADYLKFFNYDKSASNDRAQRYNQDMSTSNDRAPNFNKKYFILRFLRVCVYVP